MRGLPSHWLATPARPALFVRVRELNTRGQAPAFRAKALNTRAFFNCLWGAAQRFLTTGVVHANGLVAVICVRG